jgi:3-deoxy-D-manno-octulosonic-acid transferase
MKARVATVLYTLLWWIGLPVVAAYLGFRALRQREYLHHWGERFFGRGAAFERGARVAWVHAVSLGETRAAQPLIEALAGADADLKIVLTHMTPTGRAAGAAIAQKLPGRVLQRYLPYDLPFATRRFLAEVRPALGVVMETEIWPNLLFSARAAGVPMALANARLSEKSLASAMRWPTLVRAAVGVLARVLAQTEADRARIARLYDGPIDVAGNLKFDLTPDAAQLARGRAWRQRFGGRPVWLVASSREGEEAMLLDALDRAGPAGPGRDGANEPLIVIVPRHPQRFDDVERLLAARGRRVVRRSGFGGDQAPELPAGTVLLGDSMGELAAYYAAADVALIGGSLAPLGGQNLIEACACGCPVVVGPHTFNFAQAAEDAIAAGAALRVPDAHAAVAALDELVRDAARLERMRAAALSFAHAHRGATARAVQALQALLRGADGTRSERAESGQSGAPGR